MDWTRTGASPPIVMTLVFQTTVACRVALLGAGPKGNFGRLLDELLIGFTHSNCFMKSVI
jgi:hypothetical protein